jgi:4-hydroxy-2-oxoheptanedioate aldolase
MTEYLQQANDSLLTMVQIETREALDAVEDIAAVDGVDVLFVGPFDLGKLLLSLSPSFSRPLSRDGARQSHRRMACPLFRRVLTPSQGNNIGYPILDGVMAPELDAAIAKVLAAAKAAGKKTGIFCTSGEQSKAYADQGFDMISVATDLTALQHTVKESLSIARGGSAPEKVGNY